MKRLFRLWGLENQSLDVGLSLLTLILLALSRLALLASGPWEWDETLFARGMLHFELAAHFPHPPGFPGWLAIGHLLLPVAGSPLRALQLASAFCSVLALWPLAMLGRRVAPPAVATAAALLVLFLPGPWFFSVRGFSSTAASTCLYLGALLLCRTGEDGKQDQPWYRDEITHFTLFLTAAFLIRPILLPPIALLWIVGAWVARPWRRLLPGALAGSAAILISMMVMVHLEGGWEPFAQAFITHARHHSERLYLNTGGFGDLGLIKGFGGSSSAGVMMILSLIGLRVWGKKRGHRSVLVWILVIGLTVLQLYFLQNRSYARYAVPVQMATAPLLAGACSLVPATPASIFLLTGALVSAAWSYPILEEQHTKRLAAWEATEAGESRALEKAWSFVVGPEIHPFASYLQHLDQYQGKKIPKMLLSPRALAPWEGTNRPWVVATIHPELYLPSLNDRHRSWGGVSSRLYPLSQQRFLSATLIDNPPLPLGQWWTRNTTPDGQIFMWAGPEASLLIPPLPKGSRIGIPIQPAPGPEALSISVDRRELSRVPGESDRRRIIWIWRDSSEETGPTTIGFHRAQGYPPGNGDERPLSVQVFEPIFRFPGEIIRGRLASASERKRLGLEIDGAWAPENFGTRGRGIWLKPHAQLRLDISETGELRLQTFAPRPTPPRTRIAVAGGPWLSPATPQSKSGEIRIHIDQHEIRDHQVELEVENIPFRPSTRGSSDQRDLGVVLFGLEFIPDQAPLPGWWNSGDDTSAKASSAR